MFVYNPNFISFFYFLVSLDNPWLYQIIPWILAESQTIQFVLKDFLTLWNIFSLLCYTVFLLSKISNTFSFCLGRWISAGLQDKLLIYHSLLLLCSTLTLIQNIINVGLLKIHGSRVGFSRGRLEESSQEALNSQAKFWAKITHFCRDFEIWPKISHFCRDFISEWWIIAEISCVWKKFWVKNFMSQEISSWNRKSLSCGNISSLWYEIMTKVRDFWSYLKIATKDKSAWFLLKTSPETSRLPGKIFCYLARENPTPD